MRRLEPSLMRYPAVSTFFNTWKFPTTFPEITTGNPTAARPDYGPWGGGPGLDFGGEVGFWADGSVFFLVVEKNRGLQQKWDVTVN